MIDCPYYESFYDTILTKGGAIMKATGLIVEYNPFHNGHLHHLEQAKVKTNADCLIACMSGNFLQRGEPALVDKFHRAKMAIDQGVDLVIELPYLYAVQHSDLFSLGAVKILNELTVDYLIFGSEAGEIDSFQSLFHTYMQNKDTFNTQLKKKLAEGLSFPKANQQAFELFSVDKETDMVDLTKPNNILGFSYLKAIAETNSSIKIDTIARKQSDYHDETLTTPIASATSIRKTIKEQNKLSAPTNLALPINSHQYLESYKKSAGIWHSWEAYFPFLQFRVLTESKEELAQIQGVDEGLEYALIQSAHKARSFTEWIDLLKSKRYTYTRLQRMFVHLLTNTSKDTISRLHQQESIVCMRLLGMSEQGKRYLNHTKKIRSAPVYTQLRKELPDLMKLDERATDIYYLPIALDKRQKLRAQEFSAPYYKKSR